MEIAVTHNTQAFKASSHLIFQPPPKCLKSAQRDARLAKPLCRQFSFAFFDAWLGNESREGTQRTLVDHVCLKPV